MSKVKIRTIREEDVTEALALGRKMHSEGAFSVLSFSEKKVKTLVERCVSSPGFLCLVAKDEEKIVGFYVAVLSEDWFSEVKVAKEIALYVTPEYRKSGIASRLIKGFLTWAVLREAVVAGAGTSSGLSNDSVRRLYEAEGFTTLGLIFRKRI